MPIFAELRRRGVFRVVAAYLVAGWLLTEVLTTLLPTLGAPAWAERAVVLIFALGLIPAAALSWFYELTPDGIKREADIRDEDRTRRIGARPLDYVTIAGVVLLIVFVGLFSAQRTGEEMPVTLAAVDLASVAVLPFDNLSSEDEDYFSEGLAETLLHMLAQVPRLKVAARTSSFAFRGQNKSIREIASALGVAHVLEGSVQKSGNRVRITAQLIRASDGFHVWSSSYDRTLDDIFAIQDEIARKVGAELTASLLGAANERLGGVQTNNPDAYDLYLQARKEHVTYSYGGLRGAEDLLKGALLIDPDFTEAKTELASSYIRQVETGLRAPAQAYPEIRAITAQVLEVEPDNVVANAIHTYVGVLNRALAGGTVDLNDLVSRLEALVAEAPDEVQPCILLVRAYQLAQQDERAIAPLERALARDPFNAQILYELGSAHMRLQDYVAARDALQRSLQIESAQPNAYVLLALISAQEGDGVAYVRNLLDALAVDPRDQDLPGLIADFLYQLELVDEGDDFRARVVTIAPTSEIAYRTELTRALARGDADAADRSARRAIEDGVESRYFAYGGAVQHLLRQAIVSDSIPAEEAWLEAQNPGIFDIDGESVPQKYRMAQGVAMDAWYVSLPREELLRRLDYLLQLGEQMGFGVASDPFTRMSVHAMRGEVQAAVQVALDDIFSHSVAGSLGWERTFEQAQFAEVVADPRIQAAMQRWEQEEAELRESVAAFLADLQSHG